MVKETEVHVIEVAVAIDSIGETKKGFGFLIVHNAFLILILWGSFINILIALFDFDPIYRTHVV